MSCPTGTFQYTIQPGDTFFRLAQRFGTTVAAIQAANPGVNPDNLQVGQVICIPSGHTRTCPTGTFAYTVQPGDTFFRLAQRFGTTVAAIQAANPGVNPNNLQVGSTLCIPGHTTAPPPDARVCPPGTFAYIVQPGDTFFRLAQRFGTTVAAIQAANPGVDPLNLRIGSTLCIPGVTRVCPPGTFAYIVQPGDTFFLLAQRFNTTVAAIQAANPGVDPLNLQIGSTLCIPTVTRVCPPGTFAYIVQPGDTFFLLAQRFNTTVAAIQAANPGVDPLNLQIGSTLCIPGVPTVCPPGTFPYVVVAGDTCFLIAQRFGITVDQLIAANPGINCNNLQIGSTLCIPTTPTICPPGTFPYVVVAGDTCFLIAQRFGITVDQLIAANPGINCSNLQIGSTLCIPTTPTQCPPGTFPYVVVAGDTCFGIAQRFGITVDQLIAANPGINCNNLQIGQVLCIPGTARVCPEGAFLYTIRAGDTCFLLAQRYRTTVNAILAINPGLNCSNLQIGQQICIPCGASF